MARPKKLSEAFVKSVKAPGRYGDGRGGFGLSLLVRRVKSGLSKNYQQRIFAAGVRRSLGLGSVNDLSLTEARLLATSNYERIKAAERSVTGVDRLEAEVLGAALPPAAAPVPLSVPTLRDMVETTFDSRRESWKPGSRTERDLRVQLARYIYPTLGVVPVDQIDPHAITAAIAPRWHEKKAAMRKLLNFLKDVFSVAWSADYITENPIPKVKAGLGRQNGTTKHREAIPYEAAADVLRAIRASAAYPMKRLSLEFVMLNVVRAGEATGARWGEFDLDAETWTVPASRMKGGRTHRVPLSRAARRVLWQRLYADGLNQYEVEDDDFVFPNSRGDKPVRSDVLLPLFKSAAGGMTVHGLRGTFRTWVADKTDFESEVGEHVLAHLEGSETLRAYQRGTYFEKRRELMEAWAAHLQAWPEAKSTD